MDVILEFKGEYRYLSNFYVSNLFVGMRVWSTVEHYYQAMKTNDMLWIDSISRAKTPGEAKRLGQKCPMIPTWEHHKVEVMREGVEAKFKGNQDLREKLVDTGKALLVEGNNWKDEYWGYSFKTGRGKNMLGVILMDLRSEFQGDIK